MRHGLHSVVGPDSIPPPGRKFAPSSAVTSPNRPRQPHGEPVAHERPDLGASRQTTGRATEMPGSVTPRSYRGSSDRAVAERSADQRPAAGTVTEAYHPIPSPRSAAPAFADLEPEPAGHGAGLRPGAALDDHAPQVRGRHDRVAVAGPAPRQPPRPELDHPAAVVAPVHEHVLRPGPAVAGVHDLERATEGIGPARPLVPPALLDRVRRRRPSPPAAARTASATRPRRLSPARPRAPAGRPSRS